MSAFHEQGGAASVTPAKMHTYDLFNLKKRTTIVTGGIGALGLEFTRGIIIPDKTLTSVTEKLQQLAQACGSKLPYNQCDITDPGATRAIFQNAVSQARFPLRGLVACAGLCTIGPSINFSLSDWKRIVDVNLQGVFVCAQAAANIISQQELPASFVFIASMSGYVVNRGIDCAAYNCSKAGVHQLTRSLASEWGSQKDCPQIRVNSLSPGYIRTRMTEPLLKNSTQEPLMSGGSMLNRVSDPDEYRGPAVFLLSDASSFMTGADLLVDGGYTGW
ncbi:hypothetical protein BDV12DRAFT_188662 [Aspergillus spectabilis]